MRNVQIKINRNTVVSIMDGNILVKYTKKMLLREKNKLRKILLRKLYYYNYIIILDRIP